MLTFLYSSGKKPESVTVYMLTLPCRVVKKNTLTREFNDVFFKEIALNVSRGWNKAWFYSDELSAQKARQFEHGKTVMFELKLPKTACEQLKESNDSQIQVDLSTITSESIQAVTVNEFSGSVYYKITNPMIKQDEPIMEIKDTNSLLTKKN